MRGQTRGRVGNTLLGVLAAATSGIMHPALVRITHIADAYHLGCGDWRSSFMHRV